MQFILCLFAALTMWESGIKYTSNYAIDEKPVVKVNDHLQGIWKIAEDTDRYNYLIIEKSSDYTYSLTYMNRSGDNRGLEHFKAFVSEVKGVQYINLPNWGSARGYVLLRVSGIAERGWDMTATLVTDPSISTVTSSTQLRNLLEKNADNKAFYSQPIHLKKKFEFNTFGK